MVENYTPKLRLYHVTVSHGTCTVIARDKYQVLGLIFLDDRLLKDNLDSEDELLSIEDIMSSIWELPYTIVEEGEPKIIDFYQE